MTTRICPGCGARLSKYNSDPFCAPCASKPQTKARAREAVRATRRVKAAPLPVHDFIDPAPVIDHLYSLTALHGLSQGQIARRARVSKSSVGQVLRGRYRSIRDDIAARLLAVTP